MPTVNRGPQYALLKSNSVQTFWVAEFKIDARDDEEAQILAGSKMQQLAQAQAQQVPDAGARGVKYVLVKLVADFQIGHPAPTGVYEGRD